jgi:TonB family protein
MKPIRWLVPLPAAAAVMLAWSPASAQTATPDTSHAKPAADFQGMGRNLRTPQRRAGDPYELSALDEQPVLLNREEVSRAMADHYPPELRQQGAGGLVVLRFVIQADGTVDTASVDVEMATNPAFGEPAASVVRQMRFRPGTVKSNPVRTWVTLPVNFVAPTAPATPAPAAPATPPER